LLFDNRSPIVLIFDNPQYGKHYCYLEDENGKPYPHLNKEDVPLICGKFYSTTDFEYVTAEKIKRRRN